jgi:hypothetical protein
LEEEKFQRELHEEKEKKRKRRGLRRRLSKLASLRNTPRVRSDQVRLVGKKYDESIAKTPLTPPDSRDKKGRNLHFFEMDELKNPLSEGKEEENKEKKNDDKKGDVPLHSVPTSSKTVGSENISYSGDYDFENIFDEDEGVPPVNLERCVDSMYKNMHDNCDFLLKTQWTDFWTQMARGTICCRKAPTWAPWPRIFDTPLLMILLPILMSLNAVKLVLQLILFVLWIEYFAGDALRRIENAQFVDWVEASIEEYVYTTPFVVISLVMYFVSIFSFWILSMQCCKKDIHKNLRRRRFVASIKLASSLVILFFILAAICIFLIYAVHRETWGQFFLGTFIAAVFLALFAQSNTLSIFKNGNIPLVQAFLLLLILYLGPVLYLVVFSLFSEWRIFGDPSFNGTAVTETTFGDFTSHRWSQTIIASSSLLIISVVCWERLLSYVQEHYRLALASAFYVHGSKTTTRLSRAKSDNLPYFISCCMY